MTSWENTKKLGPNYPRPLTDPRDYEPLRPDSPPAKPDFVAVWLEYCRQQVGDGEAARIDERNARKGKAVADGTYGTVRYPPTRERELP